MALSILVLAVVILGLLIGGAVLLFQKLGAMAWWVVVPVAAVLAVFVLVVLVRVSTPMSGPLGMSSSGQSRIPDSARSYATRYMEKAYSSGGVRLDETFPADVYPSAGAAARGLARDLAISFHEREWAENWERVRHLNSSSDFPDVRVSGPADVAIRDEAVQGFHDVVGDTYSTGRALGKVYLPETQSGRSPPRTAEIPCIVTVSGKESGVVQLILATPSGQMARSARFETKPWVQDFVKYISDANKTVVRGMSGPAATAEAAEQEALADAAGLLLPFVRPGVESRLGRPWRDSDTQALKGAVQTGILEHSLVADRFVQCFDRPYGKVWNVQVLVDSSPEAVGPMAGAIVLREPVHRPEGGHVRQTWWGTLTSLGGTGVLIFAVYLVLNAATKGHYKTVLRVLAAGAAILAVILVVLSATDLPAERPAPAGSSQSATLAPDVPYALNELLPEASDPNRVAGKYYLVIQAIRGNLDNALSDVQEMARWCTDNGEPATACSVRSAKWNDRYVVLSLRPFDSPDSDQAKAFAKKIELLGEKYRLDHRGHSFQQNDAVKFAPWYIRWF